MIGFHYQGNSDNWPEAVARLPAGTPVKFVDGVQRCAEAKQVNPNVYTVVRHHVQEQNPSGDLHQHARNFFASFVDDSFRAIAGSVDAVQEYNEYFADSQSQAERQRWISWIQACVDVWRDEYRTQPSYAHIDLILAETAVGNNIPLEVARIAHENPFCVLGYHPYVPVWKGQIRPDHWRWYSGRWAYMDDVYRSAGYRVRWFFGEFGAVGHNGPGWPNSLAASDGWRHDKVYDGYLPGYLDMMTAWTREVEKTHAWQTGRVIGATIFTSGGGSKWKWFEVKQPEMGIIAEHSRMLADGMIPPVEPPDPPVPPDPPIEPPVPTDNLLDNHSFEDGWTDVSMTAQQPNGWELDIAEFGEDVRGRPVNGKPECVHKLASQLPPDEQPGGENALILDGTTCYKMFHPGATWRASLTQQLQAEPGEKYDLICPVNIHFDGRPEDYDPEDVLIEAIVNGEVSELWMRQELDRLWQFVTLECVAPSNGAIIVTIQASVKWEHPTSIFVDDLLMYPCESPDPPDPPVEPDCKGEPRVQYKRLVHVLPSGASKDDWLHVAGVAYDDKNTVGFSYDDAGIGALDNKTAVLWGLNPEQHTTFTEWFGKWYPGTIVEFRDLQFPAQPPVADVGVWVDVSHHQGVIDWNKMVNQGVTHCYIRCTYGNEIVDASVEANVRGAREHGITYGLYHYFRNHQNALSQAEYFLNHAPAGSMGDLPPVLDVEQDYQVGPLNPATLRVWLDHVENSTGYVPAIYTNINGWNEQILTPQPWASRYPLWVAHWTDAPKPLLPRDWDEWWLWQYGKVPGAPYGVHSRELDVNRFNE